MKKVLLVSSVPSLDVYSIGVIAAALNNEEVECYAYIFLDGTDQHSEEQQLVRYGLSPQHKRRVKFLKLEKNKAIRILSGGIYMDRVREFANQNQVSIVHFITQDVMLYGHLTKFKDYNLYYTVHDLVPHPVKLSVLQQIKHYYFRIRKDRLLVKKINNLVTNSNHQMEKLRYLYPGKRIFKHQMPGMATPAIKMGSAKVTEIRNISNYVLFFGRIEVYKGLDQLYEAFISHPDLAKIPLVIAGKGSIHFNRNEENEKNITFINRYIKDEEVGDLFTNAALFVLPYRSATQSAVTSIAYQYNLPVVGSNIEGLKDTIIHEKTGLLYHPGEDNAMAEAIKRLHSDHILNRNIRRYLQEEQPFFGERQLGQEIATIY